MRCAAGSPSPAADSAWALAATAAGQVREVGAWLAAYRGEALSADVLKDLVYLATDAKGTALAVAAAERLFELRTGGDEGLLLARVLLNADQARRALDRLRALPRGHRRAERPLRGGAARRLAPARAGRR